MIKCCFCQVEINSEIDQWTYREPGFATDICHISCYNRKKTSDFLASGTELAVILDIQARQQLGIAKYGTTVADDPLSLKQWLQHAYEEVLDQAVYLKRAIQEIDRVKGILNQKYSDLGPETGATTRVSRE